MLDEFGNEIIVDPTPQIDPNAQLGADKTFTQADVDKVITERLAREKKKYADYYDNKEKLEKLELENTSLKELSDVLKGANLGGTPAEQVDILREFYGLTKKQAEKAVDASTVKGADETTAYIKADRFSRTADDETVETEMERIFDIPPKSRTAEDELKIELLGKRYGNIKFGKEFNSAKSWFVKTFETTDEDFNEIIHSEEFTEFAQGSKLPLQKELEKYIKFTKKEVKKKEIPASMGSVKDTGGGNEKDYYTPAEVDMLSDKDLENPKIWEKVRKSMTKWK